MQAACSCLFNLVEPVAILRAADFCASSVVLPVLEPAVNLAH